MHRTALRLGLAAMIATTVTPLAHASAVTAVTATGRALHPGSVVATGRLDGDVCVFESDAVVTLRGTAAAGLGLRTDAACRLVVTRLDATPVAVSAPFLYAVAPKIDEDATAASPAGGVGGGDPLFGAGTDVATLADTAGNAVATASSTTSVHVTMSQTIYNAVGSVQYEDKIEVAYLKNTRTGSVSHLEPTDGYCRGGGLADNPANEWTDVAATEIRDCFYKTTASGPDKVAFLTGGYYRQLLLGIERDARLLTETFSERTDGSVSRDCDPGDAVPRYWTTYCFLNRVV